jgi:hypothetical protein
MIATLDLDDSVGTQILILVLVEKSIIAAFLQSAYSADSMSYLGHSCQPPSRRVSSNRDPFASKEKAA